MQREVQVGELVRVELGEDLLYRDDRRDVSIKLDALNLLKQSDSGMLTLDISGEINNLPMNVAGQLGPMSAVLSGRKLMMNLWGDLTLAGQGKVDDLSTLGGTNIDLNVWAPSSRPLLNLLGMPEVRDGLLALDGNISDAFTELEIDVAGNFGQIALEVSGTVPRPATFVALPQLGRTHTGMRLRRRSQHEPTLGRG